MNPKTAIKRLLLRHGGWEAKAWIQSRRGRNDLVFAERRDLICDIEPGAALVLAPHPDDEAIGAGGTIVAHLMSGADVSVLYLTDGSSGRKNPELVEARRAEARAVGDRYGIGQIFWDAPDTQLNSSSMLADRLASVLEEIEPKHLYLPSFFEKHVDHFIANQLVIDALSRCGDPEVCLYGYEVWDNIVKPNYHVDITAHFNKKKEMISFYETQTQETNYVRLCEARNALHHFLQCFGSSEGHAEAFFRADPVTYKAHYDAYVEVLRETGSSLVKRLAPN